MKTITLKENDWSVLRYLAGEDGSNFEEGYAYFFRAIAKETKLELREVRRICRKLARAGFTVLVRGLIDEDTGLIAGSGYSATDAGAKLMEDRFAENEKIKQTALIH